MVLDSIYRVSGGGSVKRERKGGLLMHTFIFAVSSLFLIYHFFFSHSLFFLLSFPWVLPPLLKATSLLFIWLHSMRFLPFVPKASPTIFGLWASLHVYPLTCWLPGHYICPECACYTTPHSWTKLLILFLPFPLSVLP